MCSSDLSLTRYRFSGVQRNVRNKKRQSQGLLQSSFRNCHSLCHGGLCAFEIEIFLGRLLKGESFFVVHCCPCLQVPTGLIGMSIEDFRGKRGVSMTHHSRVSVESQ